MADKKDDGKKPVEKPKTKAQLAEERRTAHIEGIRKLAKGDW